MDTVCQNATLLFLLWRHGEKFVLQIYSLCERLKENLLISLEKNTTFGKHIRYLCKCQPYPQFALVEDE